MNVVRNAAIFPSPINILLSAVSALILVLAFPDSDLWFLAWVALVPLFIAITRENSALFPAFLLGWIWGVVFFFGTCSWLTFAPSHYGGVPSVIANLLVLGACAIAAIFTGLFAIVFANIFKRFRRSAYLAAPFVWVAFEFLRFGITGNNWNAIGYSQAYVHQIIFPAGFGGVFAVGFFVVSSNSIVSFITTEKNRRSLIVSTLGLIGWLGVYFCAGIFISKEEKAKVAPVAAIVAIQPNVAMIGLNDEKRSAELDEHLQQAKSALSIAFERFGKEIPVTVIFPESPMNFMYERDAGFRQFTREFTSQNNVSLLFNSAEPDETNDGYFNSAVMINSRGEKIAQYDKIHLLPFGEFVPLPDPLSKLVPAMVGNFRHGSEYDLLSFGSANAGVMICFESHFPELSREYVRRGADALIEMTNDGYLGPTPVLRQHLANAIFRAVETNRPVLRVTNVGITAYINEHGAVLDAAESYTEATRVWSISKSDGDQTIYVRYGEWFAWLCSLLTIALLFWSLVGRRRD